LIRPRVLIRFRSMAAAAGVAGALLVIAAACTTKEVDYLTVPTTILLRNQSGTTRPIRQSLVPIPPVEGASTTAVLGFVDGTVSVSGRVLGPDGPVEGATVVLTRTVGAQTAELRVSTDKDGKYQATKIRGGILELYAYRSPDLSAVEGQVMFAEGQVKLDLKVRSFSGAEIAWSIGPSRPFVGRESILSISVGSRRVDDDGIVRNLPLEGVLVRVVPLGALQPTQGAERISDAGGLVSFPMACPATGGAGQEVVLATGESTTIEPPGCIPPPTTAPPSTEAPPQTPPPVEVAPTPAPPVVPDPVPVPVVPDPTTAPVTPAPVAPPTVAPPPV
jgi:hypothetical protein